MVIDFRLGQKLNYLTESAEILHEETADDMLIDKTNPNF